MDLNTSIEPRYNTKCWWGESDISDVELKWWRSTNSGLWRTNSELISTMISSAERFGTMAANASTSVFVLVCLNLMLHVGRETHLGPDVTKLKHATTPCYSYNVVQPKDDVSVCRKLNNVPSLKHVAEFDVKKTRRQFVSRLQGMSIHHGWSRIFNSLHDEYGYSEERQ